MTTKTKERKVKCAGDDLLFGHPLVYLMIDQTNKQECPYCGKIFELLNQ